MKQVLIYIDIMGFEDRALDEARITGRPVEDIRGSYIYSIHNKLVSLNNYNIISRYDKMSPDSWMIFAEDLVSGLEAIDELLKTTFKFEIAIAIKEAIQSSSQMSSLSNEVLAFLKSNVIQQYREIYKTKSGTSPLETFILLTEDAYNKINNKDICIGPYSDAKFYSINMERLKPFLTMNNFIKRIKSYRPEYFRIEDLFVPHSGYDKIINILESYNIVFLIGDAEVGKTFTAIKLLLDFYKSGYEPVYVPEERISDQLRLIRDGVEIEDKAIYLEDTWGKVEFHSFECIYSEIGSFIRQIKGKNCKIIISSRLQVFQVFEKKLEIAEGISKYVVEFLVATAYDNSKLAIMLDKYVEVFKPVWRNEPALKSMIIKSLSTKLQTPLSIKKLIELTENDLDQEQIIKGIQVASEETKISFAREINELVERKQYDSLTFLGLAYLGMNFEKSKIYFDNVLIKLDNHGYDTIKSRCFKELYKEFDHKKIELIYDTLRFTHPSYEEAFKKSLADKSKINNIIGTIFSNILFMIEQDEDIDSIIHLARIILKDFNIIPQDVCCRLLTKISRDKNNAWSCQSGHPCKILTSIMSEIILEYFEALQIECRQILLSKISTLEDKSFDGQVRIYSRCTLSWVVQKYFHNQQDIIELMLQLSNNGFSSIASAVALTDNLDRFQKEHSELLFLSLSKNEYSASIIAGPFIDSCNDFSARPAINILINLSKSTYSARKVIDFIIINFDKLPYNLKDLLLELAENSAIAEQVAISLSINYSNLSDNIRNQLILKLLGIDESIYKLENVHNLKAREDDISRVPSNIYSGGRINTILCKILLNYFHEIPTDLRNSTLIKLYQRNIWNVAEVIIKYNSYLPQDIIEKLFIMSQNESATNCLTLAIIDNFDTIPPIIKDILYNMSRDRNTSEKLAINLIRNINKLPEKAEEILTALIREEQLIEVIVIEFRKNFWNIPEDVRNRLLIELSKFDDISPSIALLLAEKFDALPSCISNRLDALMKKPEVMAYFNEIFPHWTTHNFSPKIRDSILFRLAEAGYYDITDDITSFIINNFEDSPLSIRNNITKNIRILANELIRDGKMLKDSIFSENSKEQPECIKYLIQDLQKVIIYIVTRHYDSYQRGVILEKDKNAIISKSVLILLLKRQETITYLDDIMGPLIDSFKY